MLSSKELTSNTVEKRNTKLQQKQLHQARTRPSLPRPRYMSCHPFRPGPYPAAAKCSPNLMPLRVPPDYLRPQPPRPQHTKEKRYTPKQMKSNIGDKYSNVRDMENQPSHNTSRGQSPIIPISSCSASSSRCLEARTARVGCCRTPCRWRQG